MKRPWELMFFVIFAIVSFGVAYLGFNACSSLIVWSDEDVRFIRQMEERFGERYPVVTQSEMSLIFWSSFGCAILGFIAIGIGIGFAFWWLKRIAPKTEKKI